MTLIKDDKSKPSSKKPSKTKNSKKDVVVKQSATEKKEVKEIDDKKLETSFEMTTELCEAESETEGVTERRSEDTTTPVPAAIDDSDDDAGPSTGVRITEEQREENLWILQKLQRNILRRLHLDDDEDDDDEDLETSEASSRSA